MTRPSDQAARTAKRLAALGHRVVLAPALEIVPTGTAPPEGEFDLILATSAQAFAGGAPKPSLRALPVACVGERTARAAEASGFRVALVAPRAEALAERLVAEMKPASALYFAGRERKPVLEDRLRAAGWAVAVVEIYDARPVAGWPDEVLAALRDGRIDAVLHYSPRSAGAALSLIGGAASRLSHFCLSQDVADICARWAPTERIFTASQPDEEALLKLLCSVEPLRGD
ncbi:uroporphyrinogen-III synthase [Rhodoblastus acidophilus]|uniref:Uroporphyrinogen-III synthase n=1 Tax=Candidatus Rhodoblastus alkanivorans TaxID=2954117 RepID=A0ABS9Z153_9HYPH|nr:uroporphyrinogen-III synthase [Candidatus Rhodoblastus alkanivorans]MCI4681389.1 uroporphyrinogen-III synthase [Candidatus Rhodoblastus alkanivorans]